MIRRPVLLGQRHSGNRSQECPGPAARASPDHGHGPARCPGAVAEECSQPGLFCRTEEKLPRALRGGPCFSEKMC